LLQIFSCLDFKKKFFFYLHMMYFCVIYESRIHLSELSGNKKKLRGKLYGNSSVRNMCVCVCLNRRHKNNSEAILMREASVFKQLLDI
jgi:hypothetical protein